MKKMDDGLRWRKSAIFLSIFNLAAITTQNNVETNKKYFI